MSYTLCVDIGGTFTDCVVADEDANLNIFKALSTPDAFERGFIDVLELAAEHYQKDLRTFLGEVRWIVHGTTVATNALVEGNVGNVGFLTNAGFPDILTLREAPRKRSFQWHVDYPEPFVPRSRTCTVRGRIDADGEEIEPLAEDDVRAAVEHFRRMGVEAIGVCLLWSIANGVHERRVRDIIRHEWPDVHVTLGHELNPIPREYRRAISSVIDASLQPIVSSYADKLMQALRQNGYTRELLMANCVGGMMPPDEVVEKPIYSVMSGPTLAPIAALQLTDEPDVIVVDMGGTTFDVSAIRDARLVVTPEAMIGNDLLGIPKVDVRSVGAGGGSIAWVDVGGLLRVGPQSAGARPGPACYGLGGTEPTVTDANVILGIIDPDYFLGGRIKLDRAAAEAAVSQIADRLGIDLVEAAYAIHTTSNHNMVTAIESITIREGINPRDSYLVCGGGATACHIGEIAAVLGIERLMVPKFSSALSAYGGLISDIRWEESATLHTDDRRFDLKGVQAVLERLREVGRGFLDRAGVPPEQQRFEYAYLGRYEYQSWDIEVPFTLSSERLQREDLAQLVKAFHDMHERIYTIKDENDTVEFTTWKVRAVGENTDRARTRGIEILPQKGIVQPKGHRKVYIHDLGGLTRIPVYDGQTIGAGATIEGPAVIEEDTFTSLLLNRQSAVVDVHGNYLLKLPSLHEQRNAAAE